MADGGTFSSFDRLKQSLSGEIHEDGFTRGRYATDASIYQMVPHAVVVPKNLQDIKTTVNFCRENHIALLPRGGGTSQCGQTVNHAVVIDNSKYFNKIINLDVENRRCTVEPGIVLDELNRRLKPHGL